MKILTGKKWKGGFLDYYRNKTEYRIEVVAFKNLEKLEDVYHTRAKSLRLLINYFPVVGLQGLITKTWSRLREDRRNEKYISCGFGKILETADTSVFKVGETVSFIAPWHPALAERIVLPKELISKVSDASQFSKISDNEILYLPVSGKNESAWWKKVKAWSIYSGTEISSEVQQKLTQDLNIEIRNLEWSSAEVIDSKNPESISDTRGRIVHEKMPVKRGILFGYGNYAKINIIPYSRPYVEINSVHEIDPTQIFIEIILMLIYKHGT